MSDPVQHYQVVEMMPQKAIRTDQFVAQTAVHLQQCIDAFPFRGIVGWFIRRRLLWTVWLLRGMADYKHRDLARRGMID